MKPLEHRLCDASFQAQKQLWQAETGSFAVRAERFFFTCGHLAGNVGNRPFDSMRQPVFGRCGSVGLVPTRMGASSFRTFIYISCHPSSSCPLHMLFPTESNRQTSDERAQFLSSSNISCTTKPLAQPHGQAFPSSRTCASVRTVLCPEKPLHAGYGARQGRADVCARAGERRWSGMAGWKAARARRARTREVWRETRACHVAARAWHDVVGRGGDVRGG